MENQAILTVEAYIAQFPPERRKILEAVREAIRREAPEAQERIRWGMPTYWQKENLIHFANQKNHIGIYPAPEAVEAFAQRLEGYKTSKGSIRFPVDKPVDYGLIGELARFRVKMVTER